MKYRILLAEKLSDDVFRLVIDARDIARSKDPRENFILGVNDQGERIPLAIADVDPDKGTIVVIFQVAGPATERLASLREGDEIPNLQVDQRRAPGGGAKPAVLIAISVLLALLAAGGVVAFLMFERAHPEPGPAGTASAAPADDPSAAAPRGASGIIQVTSRPEGAVAFVDGEVRCKATPCKIRGVAAGEHELRLEKAGYEPQTRRVRVEGGRPATRIAISMKRAGPEPGGTAAPAPKGPVGYLSIATIPPVEVQVDGETIALSPVIKHPLPPGEYKVRLYDEEAWLDQVFPVTIKKGQTTQEHFRFGKGQLEIRAIPGIEIFIGSRRVGMTPLEPITLYTGAYIVRAKDETLNRDASFTTTVIGGKKIVLPIDLRGSWEP